MAVYLSVLALVLGAVIGSFLTVVVFRYPPMLITNWRRECQTYLNLPLSPPFSSNLAWPPSQCLTCKRRLKIWHNIPVLSFIFLKGRCHYCHAAIPKLYLVIELLTAILTWLVVRKYGFDNWSAWLLLFLTWALVALFFIDYLHHLLPDSITLLLLWIGLSASLFNLYVSSDAAIAGALLGYFILWIPHGLYKSVRKKEGMGHGDFKLLSATGAWLGSLAVLNILLLAVFLALFIALILLLLRKRTFQQPLPFGSFIALASWITILISPTFCLSWTLHLP